MDTRKEQERAELHRAIWSIADALRGAVAGWDFKQYVLGMLFYRYISENLTAYANACEREIGDTTFDYAALPDEAVSEQARAHLVNKKGFFILPSQLFANVRKRAARDENLNETLSAAFRAIERSALGQESEEDFKGLFDHIYLLEEGRLVEIDEERAIQLSHFSFTPPHASSSKGAISVNDLTFSRGAFHLCAERFHLEGGEIVALTGANGSGKSTFSRLLCALERPDSGSVQIDGKTQDARALQRSVGYVFQNPDLQIFLPTVRDELMTTLSFLRLGRKEREERLEELADLFGLVLSDSALLMSQGARKRLQCAIYYSLERPFYILDEIEAALPYAESARMLSLLSSNGAGILVISHDRAFASAVSNRSCHMEEGRLYED